MEYRVCFVPTCKNNSGNSPNKIFVRVREDLREKWCRDANVEYFKVGTMFCCEDHFDPKEDLKNYYQHKLMNQEPKLKPTALFRSVTLKTQESATSELQKTLLLPESVTAPKAMKRKYEDRGISMPSTSSYSAAPAKIHAATQCTIVMVDKSTNYKVRKSQQTITSTVDMQSSQETSSAATPSLFGCTSETEESTTNIIKFQHRQIMLDLVLKKPKMYLGLPKHFLWILDYIVEKSSHIEKLHIVVCLLKIKQNDSIDRIADQFELSRTKLSTIILASIEVLANFFQNFIFCPQPHQIKENLPLVFKIRYSNIQMIIDCFEIQIAKPSNPVKQAQTWSQYKNCNTVKYLIGCTPNGFISFISKGYGGRISDKAIVEASNLLDFINPNAVVLADRGFKEIESLLMSRGISLLRPPSVYAGTKQTTFEALQSKIIASLRVHVERVIRRIREFALLKPHSVLNYKYVAYLDEIVIIACGLINLQGEIIKSD